MHPLPRRALLGATAAFLAAPARRGPVVPRDVTESRIAGLPGTHVRVVAA